MEPNSFREKDDSKLLPNNAEEAALCENKDPELILKIFIFCIGNKSTRCKKKNSKGHT